MRETPTQADNNSAHAASEGTLPSRRLWAYLAFGFTVAYIPIHLYWALGGTFWLPGGGLDKATESAVEIADWGVCVLLLIGAAAILLLIRPAGRRFHPALLLVPIWIGAVVCVSHAIYGFITKGLYAAGMHGAVNFPSVPGVSPADAAASNHTSTVLDLTVFEPWFLIEGVLLVLAVHQFLRTRATRRRWLITIIVGVALVDVLGTLLALNNLRLAVS
jgi:hypothetical protein